VLHAVLHRVCLTVVVEITVDKRTSAETYELLSLLPFHVINFNKATGTDSEENPPSQTSKVKAGLRTRYDPLP
jgi:hypothetical protein